MGSFVFKWPHEASEVYVTGTFDDWGKTVKLEKVGDIFEKDVELAKADEKIYYKFVVDGTWTTDHTAPQEDDGHANVNNVLKPEDIKTKGGIASAILSSVGAGTTTSELAGSVPLEGKSSPPGAFPETPAQEPQEFSVKPIPASHGTGNPVSIAPGEKVPEPTSDTHYSAVTTSQEDYEKAGSAALPAAAAGVAGGDAAAEEFSVPEKSENMIPESSLPVESTNATIQSAGAETTTADLAGQQPLEPKREAKVVEDETPAAEVPEPVKESIEESKESPEAAANPEAVKEKAAVESELLKEVKTTEATGEPANGATDGVPEVVKESIIESHQGPEATTNPEAVAEKSAVESELLKEVKPSDETGEPAPTTTAATSATAPAATTDETPTVTTGVDSAKTPETSTPTSTKDEKKKKRISFFGKIKEKISHK